MKSPTALYINIDQTQSMSTIHTDPHTGEAQVVVNGHTIKPVVHPTIATFKFAITHKRTGVTTHFPTLKNARHWARGHSAL